MSPRPAAPGRCEGRLQETGSEELLKSPNTDTPVRQTGGAFTVLTFHCDPGPFRRERQVMELHLTPVLTRILLLDRLHTGDKNGWNVSTSTRTRNKTGNTNLLEPELHLEPETKLDYINFTGIRTRSLTRTGTSSRT